MLKRYIIFCVTMKICFLENLKINMIIFYMCMLFVVKWYLLTYEPLCTFLLLWKSLKFYGCDLRVHLVFLIDAIYGNIVHDLNLRLLEQMTLSVIIRNRYLEASKLVDKDSRSNGVFPSRHLLQIYLFFKWFHT